MPHQSCMSIDMPDTIPHIKPPVHWPTAVLYLFGPFHASRVRTFLKGVKGSKKRRRRNIEFSHRYIKESTEKRYLKKRRMRGSLKRE